MSADVDVWSQLEKTANWHKSPAYDFIYGTY